MVNHKRVRRLYRDEGLRLRVRRPRRHVSGAQRVELPVVNGPNEVWSMDFVSDALFGRRGLRALTLLDIYTRESLAIEVDKSIAGEDVADIFRRVVNQRVAPARIRPDNCPKFVSNALDRWVYENGVTLDFIRPGEPIKNAYV